MVRGDDLSGLTDWLRSLRSATNDFETKIHPHGKKWWRYRWQYTVVEMILLCILWLIIWALHRLFKDLGIMARARVTRLRNRNDASSLYQYAYFFVLFHFGTIGVLFFGIWALHDFTSFFNSFARIVRHVVVEDFGGESPLLKRRLDIPFRGESYYDQLSDILAHLFFAFLLYGLCMLVLIRRWVCLSDVWQDLHDTLKAEGRSRSKETLSKPEFERYRHTYTQMQTNFWKIVETHEHYNQVFQDHKIGQGGSLFQFNDYLDEAMGRFSASLFHLEFGTALVLFVFFAVSGWASYVLQMGFQELLISAPVLIAVTVFLVFMILVFLYLRNRIASDDPAVEPLSWVTTRGFAKTIQVFFYVFFYSISRVVLSKDFWSNDFWIACLVLAIGLAFFVCLHIFLADLLEFAALALAVPPDVDVETFRSYVDSLTRGLRSNVRE